MTSERRKQSLSSRKRKQEFRLALIWISIKSIIHCLITCLKFLWQHNPVKVITKRQRRIYFVENYEGVIIKPRLKERIVDLLLTDYQRRQRLLHWVHLKLRSNDVHDFSTCWQDGTVLCALLESICPGVCPSYHLLSHLNMVKNCRLGINLASKYLYVPMDLLTPEEMAIGKKESEVKIIQYISVIRWASQNIKDKWSSLHESLIAAKTGRCFAKGSSLKNGIVGRRSKFTVVVSDTICVFNLLVEVRLPNKECVGERIVSLHQAKGVLGKHFDFNETNTDAIKCLEDVAGNTFIRQKLPPRNAKDSSVDPIGLDFQCGEEGTFYVTFVPCCVGIHTVSVVWQNHHVENSPFRVKVYKASTVSTKSLKGAQEKRVIFDSLSVTTIPCSDDGSLEGVEHKDVVEGDLGSRVMNAVARSKAYSKGRQLTVTGRRVLRRIITRNGEDIVIEEAISPTLSRQSSITDTSDDDNRHQRREREDKRHSPSFQGQPVTNSPHIHGSSTQKTFNTYAPLSINTPFTHGPPYKNSSSAQGSPYSTDYPSSKNPAVYPLGTVPEENQKSKENLFKSLDLSDIVTSPTFTQNLNEYNKENDNALSQEGDIYKKEPDMITSRGIPSVKYTCTELNEHNLLEMGDKTEGEELREVEIGSGLTDEKLESTSSWFKQSPYGRDESKIRSRNPLKRTVSIHGYKKPTAHRTVSDSRIYHIRRSVVSLTASDLSETGSEISSDDKQSGNEEDNGVAGPALKLLHSHSLKKACMYISENAFSCSVPDDDVMNDVTMNIQSTTKTKVRATQSLPILNKTRFDYGDSPFTVNSEMNENKTGRLDNGSPSTRDAGGSSSLDTNKSRFRATEDQHETVHYGTNETSNGDLENSTSSPVRVVSTHEQPVNNCIDLTTDDDSKATWYHKTTLYKDFLPASKKERTSRGILTRQWSVSCQKTSKDSSSENERDDSLWSKSSECSDRLYDDNFRKACFDTIKAPFHSIFIQSSNKTGPQFTREVLIVIPRAKVDKQTQVCSTEITRETGWDMIEGFYLLLRRICVKVPYIMTHPPSSLNDSDEEVKGVCIDSETKQGKSRYPSVTNSSLSMSSKTPTERSCSKTFSPNQLQVPYTDSNSEHAGSELSANLGVHRNSVERVDISNRSSGDVLDNHNGELDSEQFSITNPRHILEDRENLTEYETSSRNTSLRHLLADRENFAEYETSSRNTDFRQFLAESENFVVENETSRSTRDNHRTVNEWFRRNESMLSVEQRQATIETVDSGFDDNPTHFNRRARFSLPSLRALNGHVKLHRRPYKGHIPLDPRLVNSISSQSVSLDKRELGNEADDELMLNPSFHQNQNQRIQRRRHRRQVRQDSVSFSDSEINQRKQPIRKRNLNGSRRQQISKPRSNIDCMTSEIKVKSTENAGGKMDMEFSPIEENPRRTKKKTEHMNSFESTDEDKLSIGNDQGDSIVVKYPDQSERATDTLTNTAKKGLTLKHSTTTSSLESNYCGFGITKPGRNALLSQIGEFQNLCTTEEIADEEISNLSKESDKLEEQRTDKSSDNTDNKDGEIRATCNKDNDNDITVKDKHEDGIHNKAQREIHCEQVTLRTDFNAESSTQHATVSEPSVYSSKASVGGDDCNGDMSIGSKDDLFENVSSEIKLNDFLGTDFYLTESLSSPDEKITCETDMYITENEAQYSKLFDDVNDVIDDEEESANDGASIRVDGAGLHHGLVGENNSFQVWTENLSTGSLSVNITGPRPHTVTQTSVLYTGDNLYEVSYGVTHPGVYKIYVKWGEVTILGSPFVCKVTV